MLTTRLMTAALVLQVGVLITMSNLRSTESAQKMFSFVLSVCFTPYRDVQAFHKPTPCKLVTLEVTCFRNYLFIALTLLDYWC